MLCVVLVDVFLVRFVDVLAQHYVSVLAHRLQPCLLGNGRDIRRADLLRPIDVVLQIYFLRESDVNICSLKNIHFTQFVRNF